MGQRRGRWHWGRQRLLGPVLVTFGVEAVRQPWNADMAVLPVALALVAGAAVAAGDLAPLPVLALAGSVAVQARPGSTPVVVAAWWWRWPGRRSGATRTRLRAR